MPGSHDDSHTSSPPSPPTTTATHHGTPTTMTRPAGQPHAFFDFHASKGARAFAKKYRTEIAASTSSILSTFAAFPLDFAKSRMQSYETGFLATVKDAYHGEGLRAFWRGVGPPLVSVTVVRTISFSLYQKVKYALDRSITQMTGESPLKIANAPGSYPTPSTMFTFGVAGMAAGAVITTISCPFELTKLNEQLAGKMAREVIQQQAQPGRPGAEARADKTASRVAAQLKSGSSWATARRLVRDRGWTGLYAGYRLHLLRDTIGTGIYFMTYESAKQILGNARGKSATSPYAVVIAGGLCGIVSWACIYPVDVAKTLYQKALLSADPPRPSIGGAASAAVAVVRPEIKFFQSGSYRGLGVSVLRSCIINMIFFSNFEIVKKYINALEP